VIMRGIRRQVDAAAILALLSAQLISAFVAYPHATQRSPYSGLRRNQFALQDAQHHIDTTTKSLIQSLQCITLSLVLALSPMPAMSVTTESLLDTTTTSTVTSKTYDGFADYAKENKMQQSDVGCFIQKCGEQTKALFSNPRGIKGVSWYVHSMSNFCSYLIPSIII